jgi:hypothetical protein
MLRVKVRLTRNGFALAVKVKVGDQDHEQDQDQDEEGYPSRKGHNVTNGVLRGFVRKNP